MKNQKFTVGIIILKKRKVFEITTLRVVLLIKCVNLGLPPVSIQEGSTYLSGDPSAYSSRALHTPTFQTQRTPAM